MLVVDDDEDVLDVMTSMLEDLGCEVLYARSGTEALHLLKNDRIDIIITDINMPDIDGVELARRAKQQKPDLGVLVVSGRETAGGGFPVLRKPFTHADLEHTMTGTIGSC
ncbi:MAG: response regulator [Bradyrhizobium sp.]|nr:response regulator [Bradyrhizobium sp.]